jgi:hypothetical protein
MLSTHAHEPTRELPAEPELILAARRVVRIEGIQSSVQRALRRAAPALGDFVDALPPKMFGVESGFFHLPIAQALDWSLPVDDWLRELGVATALGSVHYAAQDHAIDTGHAGAEPMLLAEVAQTLYARSLRSLWPDPRCEEYHDQYVARYAEAVVQEQRHRRFVVSFTGAEVYQLADKAAPLTMGFPLLIARGRRDWTRLSEIELALRLLCVGLQVLDDIADLMEDLSSGYVSLPATMTLLVSMGGEPGPLRSGLDLESVEGRMYGGGVASALYGLAANALERGAAVADDAGAAAIAGLARFWLARVRVRIRTVADLLESTDDGHAAR